MLELRDHARIQQARYIEERVLKRAQTNDGGDIVLLDEHADLGFIFRDVLEEIRSRCLEVLLDSGRGGFKDVPILIDDHGAGKISRGCA